MKIQQEKKLTLNESLAAAYELWEAGQDEKMVRLAINARLVVFREPPHILISSANGRCA
jgi:hypothetical protein